jgi:hypothetical protein
VLVLQVAVLLAPVAYVTHMDSLPMNALAALETDAVLEVCLPSRRIMLGANQWRVKSPRRCVISSGAQVSPFLQMQNGQGLIGKLSERL